MSEENINRDPTLATPHYFQPPSLQESVQESLQESAEESGDDLQLPPPATQESHGCGGQLQLLPPSVQESLEFYYIPNPYFEQESPYYNFFEPNNGEKLIHQETQLEEEINTPLHPWKKPTARAQVQASRMSKETINLDLSLAPPNYFQPPSAQEAIQESLQESHGDGQLQLPPPAVHESHEFTYIPNPYFELNNEQQLLPQETQPEEEEEITPLHPWAKSTQCEVQTLDYLLSKNILKISGEMMCTKCKNKESLEYKLMENFGEVCKYIKEVNPKQLTDRKSLEEIKMWPLERLCEICRTYTLKPVISEKKEEINWLFLMLGQMLGFCTKYQLRYFCELNKQPRSYAKDVLVYIVYVVICKQLDPTLPFKLSTFQN